MKKSSFRLIIVRYIVCAFLVFLILYAAKLQLIDGEYYRQRSNRNCIRLIPIKAMRGRILDRNNRILAANKPSFNLSIIPSDFNHELKPLLATISGVAPDVLDDLLAHRFQPSFVPVLVKRDLTVEQLHRIEERSADFGGVIIEVGGKRYYPYGEVGSHIIGYLGKLSPEEYEVNKMLGCLIDDYTGRAGIEYMFNEVLRGVHGGKQIEVNARGQQVRELAYREPFSGTDITVTLDIELQKKILEGIGNEKAAVCMMNVVTGEVIALISTPGYDPNIFVTPSRSRDRMPLLQDKNMPFLNRAISAVYPPGSVFKLLIALAGLEKGVITPESTMECTGSYQLSPGSRPFKCWNPWGHGTVNLEQAIQQSCNVYFYKVGRMLGADTIAEYAKRVGLDQAGPLELPRVTKGVIPSTAWKQSQLKKQWYQGETLHYAIGQGYLALSPFHVLRMVALIANDGVIVEPTIIKGVMHQPQHSAIQKEHVRFIKEGMLKAVGTEAGTAHAADVDMFEIAAKTGTAETVGEAHSWFAGFFPYKKPEVAVVVLVEHGGKGGGKAAEIARHAAVAWHAMKEGT